MAPCSTEGLKSTRRKFRGRRKALRITAGQNGACIYSLCVYNKTESDILDGEWYLQS